MFVYVFVMCVCVMCVCVYLIYIYTTLYHKDRDNISNEH